MLFSQNIAILISGKTKSSLVFGVIKIIIANLFRSKILKPKVTTSRWQKSLSVKNIAKISCFMIRKFKKNPKFATPRALEA